MIILVGKRLIGKMWGIFTGMGCTPALRNTFSRKIDAGLKASIRSSGATRRHISIDHASSFNGSKSLTRTSPRCRPEHIEMIRDRFTMSTYGLIAHAETRRTLGQPGI